MADYAAMASSALEGMDVDETIVEYISSMLEDPDVRGDKGTLEETLGAFLPDADSAAKVVEKLMAAMSKNGGAKPPAPPVAKKAPARAPVLPPTSAPAPASAASDEVDTSNMTSAQKRQARKDRLAKAKAARGGSSTGQESEAEQQAKRRAAQLQKEQEELEKHAPKKLDEAMRFQTEAVVAGEAPPELLNKTKTVNYNPRAGKTKAESIRDRKNREKMEAKVIEAKRRQFEKVKAEQIKMSQELEAARYEAVKLRAKNGAYMGAIEAKMFSLPNPGGGQDLLEDASFCMVRGRRYGLIGRNGKGKSTLLRWLAARRVGNFPPEVTVHYVSQDVTLTEEQQGWKPIQMLLDADIERKILMAEVAELEESAADSDRLSECMQRLQLIDADGAEVRGEKLLKNLGFSDELLGRQMKALSGGWQVRTCLAAAIFARPDVLLLDEPTNHLSIGAVLWLQRELTTNEVWNQSIIVVVSHDRVFMDEVCGDVLHISGIAHRLQQSHGSYTTWAKRRAEQQKAFDRRIKLKGAEAERLEEFAGHGFRYGGSPSQIAMMQMKAKQAEKIREEMKLDEFENAGLAEDAEVPLSLHAGGEIRGHAIHLQGVGFGYPADGKDAPPENFLFQNAEFIINTKSRMVLLGENGNGKTTLVKLMTGKLSVVEGTLIKNPRVRIALVNQHHADQIDLTMTPLEFMKSKFPGDHSYAHEQVLRSHLAECGVNADMQITPASALSGGQRSRVALAAVSYVKPHVLIMDEPTNNLDLESVAALADCVERFEGGVVIVSHDQYFVSRVAKEVLVVGDGRVKRVESFDLYRSQQLKALKAA